MRILYRKIRTVIPHASKVLDADTECIFLRGVEGVGEERHIQLELSFFNILRRHVDAEAVLYRVGTEKINGIHDIEVLLDEPIAVAYLHRNVSFAWLRSRSHSRGNHQ